MYNFFTHQLNVKEEEQHQLQELRYSSWRLRHQDFKDRAKDKQKLKLQDWVQEQMTKGPQYYFEDDHYKQWRINRQFRDVQNQENFQGYKTFRHKPHYEMDKYYSQRQRKEIQYLANKKKALIQTNKIHEFEKSRSLRSQGPLHPKIQFRTFRKHHEVMQPKLRFTNITDKQRMNQSAVSFDDKFKTVYKSFQLKRSKIGMPKISKRYDNQQSLRSKPFLNYIDDTETINQSKQFHYENIPNNQQESRENQKIQTRQPKFLNMGKGVDPNSTTSTRRSTSKKTYFKLAKTMELQGCSKLKKLLLDSQYDRKKDLSNIKMNMSCQNYHKMPVL